LVRKYHPGRAAALTIFVFSLLVWLYVVLIQVTHPEWLPAEFSHHDFPPFNWRLDNVGMIAFALAIVGFFLWQLEETKTPERRVS
jgi:hypothetical protein